jgi:hypothetical protein
MHMTYTHTYIQPDSGNGARRAPHMRAHLIHVYMHTYIQTNIHTCIHTYNQIAATELGVPLTSVHISDTTTDKCVNTMPTAGSVSADLNGFAVQVIYACRFVYMYMYVYMYMCTCVYAHAIHTHEHANIRIYIYVYIYIYIYIYTYTCIHKFIYIYIYRTHANKSTSD